MLPSPSSQQNHKRKANSPFPCSKAKKVAAALVFFFFNTKLQPSLLYYKGKRKKKKVTVGAIAFFVKLRFQKKENKATAVLLPSPASLHYTAAQLHNRVAFFYYAAAQLHSRKKATATVVTFFVELRCSATPLQREEGDGSCRRLLHGAALQRISAAGRRRRW